MAKKTKEPEAQLPPHSEEAEAGVLGCILLAPTETIPVARKKLRDEDGAEFYDQRHRVIWRTLCWMFDELMAGRPIAADGKHGDGIDMITVGNRLRDAQNLESCGGLVYLSQLPDRTASAANLDYYLDIVVSKYVLRKLVDAGIDLARRAQDWPGTLNVILNDAQSRFDALQRYTISGDESLSRLKNPVDFGEEYWQAWFGNGSNEDPGAKLPECFGGFPFRIRESEMSLVLGEKGKGKTTLLSYIVLHLLSQGMKFVVASFESAPVNTLKLLHTQLVGTNRLPDGEAGQALFTAGLAWLNPRVAIYDFQGIADYREVVTVFNKAREQGFNGFVVDNIMKLGVAEDDMSGHGAAANAFADFAIGQKAHLFMVNHLRKSGDGGMRNRSRGSLRWVDASANVVGIERNEKKWDKIAPIKEQYDAGRISQREYLDQTASEREEWDAKFILTNQRLQGTQQNGSKALWFLARASQYFDHNHSLPEQSRNWLKEWGTNRKAKS